MDKILLSMLLFRQSTIYEIRSFIRDNMRTICSDSMGSIQAGLKKLLDSEFIGFNEITENNVKKKVYYATESGRNEFIKWISQSMDTTKSKNMEFSKFFFMGMLPLNERISLIEKYLEKLKSERDFYASIKSFSEKEKLDQIDHSVKRINNDPITKTHLESITDSNNIYKIVEDYITWQFLGLEFAIDKNKFEIDWYIKILNELKNERS